MADADLDVVIRRLAKQQNKDIMEAAKRRRDHYAGLAAKAKDSAAKEKYRQIARATLMQGTAAAKRLQLAADNAADSYARSIRNAAQEAAAKKPAEKPAKKAKAPAS